MFKFENGDCIEIISDDFYLVSQDFGQTWAKYHMASPIADVADRISHGAKFEIISLFDLVKYGFSLVETDWGWEIASYPQWVGCQTEQEANVLAQEAGWNNWQEEWQCELAPLYGESTLAKIRRQKELLLEDRDN